MVLPGFSRVPSLDERAGWDRGSSSTKIHIRVDWNSRLWSWKMAAADAGEKPSRLPEQDTGGSDALCLGATPVQARMSNKYTYGILFSLPKSICEGM
jgi:hypothetical protein